METKFYNYQEWKSTAKKHGLTIRNHGAMAGTPEKVEIHYASHSNPDFGGVFYKGKVGTSWNYGHLNHPESITEDENRKIMTFGEFCKSR